MQINILYIHQYFKTPEEGGVTRSYEIAKQLAQKGHRVTMITSWNKPQQRKKIIDKIEVIYLPIPYSNNFSFIRRIWSFLNFKTKALLFAKNLPKPDIIYATSTPLTVGLIGHELAKHFKCPWIFEVRDLWPEVPVQLGIINAKWLKNYLYKLESILLKSANQIIALSPYNKKYIDQIVPQKCTLATNFSNNERYRFPTQNNNQFQNFRIGYFGAVSTANGLESFIELARYAHQNKLSEFEFVLVGAGKSKNDLEASAKGLNNITFQNHLNKVQVAEAMLTCQASYISFINNSIMQSCSPNKFFDSLASGRLIITNTPGWIAETIEKNDCGFYANSSEDFFRKITPFATSSEQLQNAQESSKKLAVEHFDKTIVINKIEKIIIEACI